MDPLQLFLSESWFQLLILGGSLYRPLLTVAHFTFLDGGRPVKDHRISRSSDFFPVNRPGEADILLPPSAEDGSPEQGGGGNEVKKQDEEPSFAASRLPTLLGAVYLFSAVCFILCLRGLSTPKTAKRGNLLGVAGMAAAILVTFTVEGFNHHYVAFILATLPAALAGLYIAHHVDMVQMPQLVALFHSFVGLAAMLVGFSIFHSPAERGHGVARLLEITVGEVVAGITVTGSIVAAAKLHDIMSPTSLKLPGKHAINIATATAIVVLVVAVTSTGNPQASLISLYALAALSLWLGFHLVASIGGADMPVVISLLNSYSGFATAASGFMLDNNLLIIAGSLIGSSGAILSHIMCCGMNRELWSVILGGWEEAAIEGVTGDYGDVRRTTTDAVAGELLMAHKVLIIPGYGMAVSKCQSDVADIAKVLLSLGISVEFGIHPVAGRMPGHMNVLLAEADIPYSIVKEMAEVNRVMMDYDVVLVVGANDTVNPASLEPGTKIYGMPVIEVWKASRVVVLKRSLAAGYAAIENPLFYLKNTRMLFGDAKDTTAAIFANLKQRASFLEKSDVFAKLEKGEDILEPGPGDEAADGFPPPGKILGVLKDANGRGTPIVSVAPRFAIRLRRNAFGVCVQRDAGAMAGFTDADYEEAGAEIVADIPAVIAKSDIILKISVPSEDLIRLLPPGKILICHVFPGQNAPLLEVMAAQGITVLALDEVPRITRAQSVDVRSSMQGLQGYRAVLEAFNSLPRLSKASITAAGRVEAARVLVLGAGVAGLQAISTAHSLGAQVFAYDVRSATKEEVESCGGTFLPIEIEEEGEVEGGYARDMGEAAERAQKQMLSKYIPQMDVVICTAAIHGKPSPKLVTKEMVATMRAGSVVLDLATEFGDRLNGWGGNVEISPTDGEIIYEGITVIGRSRIETAMPTQASELFSMNITNLLEELGGGQQFSVNLEDEVIKALCCVYEGSVVWCPPQPASRRQVSLTKRLSPRIQLFKEEALIDQLVTSDIFFTLCLLLTAGFTGLLGEYGPSLMTGPAICAMCATFLASINIAGGFYVTHRMAQMFQLP